MAAAISLTTSRLSRRSFHAQCIGEFADGLGENGGGAIQLWLRSTKDDRIRRNSMVHQFGARFLVQQTTGVAIEEQINPADMNPKMICLGNEDIIGQAARNVLMGVTRDEDSRFRKLGGEGHDLIGEIVASRPILQSHVSGENDGIRA